MSLNKELQKNLPLEFQKINEVKRKIKKNEVKIFTTVDFYQSNKIKPENFYKPISKIILFENE